MVCADSGTTSAAVSVATTPRSAARMLWIGSRATEPAATIAAASASACASLC